LNTDTEQDKYHDNEVVSVNTEDEGNAAQDDADQEAVVAISDIKVDDSNYKQPIKVLHQLTRKIKRALLQSIQKKSVEFDAG